MPDLAAISHSGRFGDKVVVVAGVGPGVGLATALRFGLEGARVAVAARSDTSLQHATEELARHGVVHVAIAADVGTETGAAEVMAQANRHFGGVDVLACTAGGYAGGGLRETDGALLEQMLDVNLRTVFHSARAASATMAARGRGAIVVTTAVFGAVVPGPGLLAYNTSKGAATALVQSLAGDLAPSNIRVNAVLPGATSHHFDAAADVTSARSLLKGAGTPQDIAAAVLFLASDEAAWITGATLIVDGGFSVSRKPY